jgi:hypothetical protein
VTHTGIFKAKITFTEPITVSWVNGETITELGVMDMNTLSANHHRATISETTRFNITDEAAFGAFAAAMITQPTFQWRLTSSKLKVAPLKFPVAHGLHFKKTITLNGRWAPFAPDRNGRSRSPPQALIASTAMCSC